MGRIASDRLQIAGVVTLKGEMKAGAKLNFGKAEVYWPQDDSSSDKYQTLLGVKSDPSAQSKELIEPTFDAKVRIDAQIDVKVTPEVSLPVFFTYPVPPLGCSTVASLCRVLTDCPRPTWVLGSEAR